MHKIMEKTFELIDMLDDSEIIKVAVIGKPNSGKSSLMNYFIEQSKLNDKIVKS